MLVIVSIKKEYSEMYTKKEIEEQRRLRREIVEAAAKAQREGRIKKVDPHELFVGYLCDDEGNAIKNI